MKRITFAISGEFEDSDLAAFMMLLRTIDNRNSEGRYALFLLDGDGSLTEAEAMLRRMVPEMAGRETKFTIHRRQ